MLEGDVKSELVRVDYPVIRIWEVDPHTRERTRELDLPFRPGPFEWGPRHAAPGRSAPSVCSPISFGLLGSAGLHEEVLTTPRRSVPLRRQGIPAGRGPARGARG